MNVQMMKQREKLVKQESTASSSFHEEEDEEGKSSGTDSTGTYHPTKGKGENDLANSKKNRIHEMVRCEEKMERDGLLLSTKLTSRSYCSVHLFGLDGDFCSSGFLGLLSSVQS